MENETKLIKTFETFLDNSYFDDMWRNHKRCEICDTIRDYKISDYLLIIENEPLVNGKIRKMYAKINTIYIINSSKVAMLGIEIMNKVGRM